MSKFFSSYQSQNNHPFQVKQKDKEYSKYLKRIEAIVHKKNSQDDSPSRYMKVHKLHKEMVHRLAKSEIEETINNENALLLSKIMSVKNRGKSKSPERRHEVDPVANTFQPPMYLKRKEEIEKINHENQEMAARLAKTYTLNRQGHSQSVARIPVPPAPGGMKASLYLKDRKLPELNQIASKVLGQKNSKDTSSSVHLK